MSNNILPYKELSIFDNLMEHQSKQTKKRMCSAEDKIKMVMSSITSILTESEPEFSKNLLDSISKIIFEILVFIKDNENPVKVLDFLINKFDPTKRIKPLSVSRTFMQEHIPRLTHSQMERVVEENYIEEMKFRKENNAQSKEVTLAVDLTHQSIDTKYINGDLAYLVEGQVRKFTRGFNFFGVYDVTDNLGLGIQFTRYHNKLGSNSDFKPWIKELQSKIQIVHSTGSNVKLIEADRGYFDTQIFAASHLRLLDTQNIGKRFIRVLIPKKFPPGKEKKKWDFLLDPLSQSVNAGFLKFRASSMPFLAEICRKMGMKQVDYDFYIPTVEVALVGEYNGNEKYTLEWAKNEARYIENKIITAREQKQKSERTYLDYKSKFSSTAKLPNYKRGKNRKKFKDSKEKSLYSALFHYNDQLDYYIKKKSDLLTNLLFFTISLDMNEDPMKNPEKYIRFAMDYHERWMIENCFRDIKKYFIPKSRSRKPTRRQFNFMIGMILYNKWERYRIFEVLKNERQRVHNIVPWNSRRRHIRKKWSNNKLSKLSARLFILQMWTSGLLYNLKSIFKQLETNR